MTSKKQQQQIETMELQERHRKENTGMQEPTHYLVGEDGGLMLMYSLKEAQHYVSEIARYNRTATKKLGVKRIVEVVKSAATEKKTTSKKQNEISFTDEEKKAIKQAANRTWQQIAYDIFECSGEQTMTQDDVIEVVLDADHMRFNGGLSRELMKRVYAASDAVIMPIMKDVFKSKLYGR